MSTSPLATFLSIKDASRHFSLPLRRLLSLGADGRLMMYAPVLNAGTYIWPSGMGSAAFPEIPPLKRHFGASDRVVLSPASVREIEGTGWSDVRSFVDVDAARAVLKDTEWALSLRERQIVVRTSPGLGKAGYSVQQLVNTREYRAVEPTLEDHALVSPWLPVRKRTGKREVTTVRHLFVKAREIQALVEGPDNAPTHGNTLKHAEKREEVLAAALHLQHRQPTRCSDATKLAREIEKQSERFWPVKRMPPLELRSIEDLLQHALRTGRIRGRN